MTSVFLSGVWADTQPQQAALCRLGHVLFSLFGALMTGAIFTRDTYQRLPLAHEP